MTFQPAPEIAFQFLDDLAVAAHRAVEPLQVAVDDEDQIVQILAGGQGDGAQDSGSSISPSPQKHQTLRPSVLTMPRLCRYFMNRA